MDTSAHYLENILHMYRYYHRLGTRALEQLEPVDFHWQADPESNSIAILIKHMAGNMRSRFTDFLTSDGEKPWRHRDQEFVDPPQEQAALLTLWEAGWKLTLDTIAGLKPEDLMRLVYIRQEGHTVSEALLRQLGHYAYHVGQIVMLARQLRGEKWQSLSIPRGQSEAFNAEKFAQKKQRKPFYRNS